jgi:hypothetical protein
LATAPMRMPPQTFRLLRVYRELSLCSDFSHQPCGLR